jgi:plasmid maintenance system antidote protein VapI
MGTLSKSQFARRLHVSPARVTQLIAKGMPVTVDGNVDVTAALSLDRVADRPRSRVGRSVSGGETDCA